MALFGSKKKETKKASQAVAAPVATMAPSAAIIRPRVTEKSGILSQSGVYTFEVAKGFNKNEISRAVTALYKVVPVKVAVINTPGRRVFVKGRKGSVSGIRKALVTLKKGDKIEFV